MCPSGKPLNVASNTCHSHPLCSSHSHPPPLTRGMTGSALSSANSVAAGRGPTRHRKRHLASVVNDRWEASGEGVRRSRMAPHSTNKQV